MRPRGLPDESLQLPGIDGWRVLRTRSYFSLCD